MSLDWEKFKEAQLHYVTAQRAPCSNPAYVNQCALRVTNSLIDAGWPFNGSNQPYTSTRFGPLCEHGHARGAKSLADYLEVYLVKPKRYVVPMHPVTRQREVNVAGEYESNPDGTYTFHKVLAWLERRALQGQQLRGIIFFNNPEHIDGFDLSDRWNTQGPFGIIGEEYGDSCTEIRVFFV